MQRHKQVGIALVLVLLIAITAWRCEVNLQTFITGFHKGLPIIGMFFPPEWVGLADMLAPMGVTIVLAILATMLSMVLSLPCALAASSNLAPAPLRFVFRGFIALERGLPEFVQLLLLVAVFGLGVIPGLIALSLSSIGMLAKLLADVIEEIEPHTLEAVAGVGASNSQVIRYAVIPQILPALFANGLFRFEFNVRAGVILGAVGGGGIGYEMSTAMRSMDYRTRLRSHAPYPRPCFPDRAPLRLPPRPDLLRRCEQMTPAVPANLLPSRKLRFTALYIVLVVGVMSSLFWYLQMSPASFMVDIDFIGDLFHQFFPPKLSLFFTKPALWMSMLDTLSMAFLATMCGGAIALVLAFFAATNTTPHPLVRLAVRTLLVVKRSIPQLIVVLVLLIAVGIGPFAGVLTLTIASVGMFGKFFADSIEQADKGIAESVQSVGSTRLQTIRYAIFPQVMPSFIANLFYAFDNNLRAAIPLGVFGGGGIGFELAFAHGLLHYRDVMAYTIMIVVMITVMERISDWVRRSILTQPLQIIK